MTANETYDPIDRLFVGGAFLAFLFGPAITFAIGGDYLAAAIGLLSPLGVVAMVEAGFYDDLKAAATGDK